MRVSGNKILLRHLATQEERQEDTVSLPGGGRRVQCDTVVHSSVVENTVQAVPGSSSVSRAPFLVWWGREYEKTARGPGAAVERQRDPAETAWR